MGEYCRDATLRPLPLIHATPLRFMLAASHLTVHIRTEECPLCEGLCCKSPKLPGDKFPARRRTNRRPAICVGSIALPRSPVNSSSGDEVPHIFTRKSRLQPGEFLITSAKRLLQQYLPIGDIPHTATTLHSLLQHQGV